MKPQTKEPSTNRCLATDLDGLEETKPPTAKESWLQEYAGRILDHFLQWQTPLGISPAYAGKIKTDLDKFYDDPLKRLFIEATY